MKTFFLLMTTFFTLSTFASEIVLCSNNGSSSRTVLSFVRSNDGVLSRIEAHHEGLNTDGTMWTNEFISTDLAEIEQLKDGNVGYTLAEGWTSYTMNFPAGFMNEIFNVTLQEYDVHEDYSFEHHLTCKTK